MDKNDTTKRRKARRDKWERACAEAEVLKTQINFCIGTREPGGELFTAVSVAKIDRDGPHIIEPDAVVIPAEEVWFEYDYPIRNKVRFQHSCPGGFSRRMVYITANEDYNRIYDEEEAAVGHTGTIAEVTDGRCGLRNRAPSNGPYGIWGHDIGDLYIEGCSYDTEHKVLRFHIGS